MRVSQHFALTALLLTATAAAAPPAPLTIDKATTWFTAPILSDGTIDYPAALRALTAPPTPESRNAAPLLEKSSAAFHEFAEGVIDGPTKIRLTNYADSLNHKLWSPTDYPDIAAWIERNGAAFDLLDQASRRPILSSPAAIDQAWLTHVEIITRCLTERATMRAAAGDQPAARADVAILFRLAPLFQRHVVDEIGDMAAARAVAESGEGEDDLHLPPDITTDPYSNEPLFFFRSDENLTVYSVGPNRRNDLGRRHTFLNDPNDDIAVELTP